jgi:peptidoglycan hydrolase-like protein with peptidoglycan-binding domain
MFRVALLGVLALAACSQPSQPAAQVPAPPMQSAAQSAAQSQRTETRAANRDSTATRDQIKGVQGRLARDGFYLGPIDGVWGPATADAVSRYQHAHGFEETGKLNRETLDSFNPP